MRELFVWYRVAADAADAARAVVTAMQSDLRASHDGLVARLLRRSDADGPLQTWMETYARPGHAAGIDAALEARIAAAAGALAGSIDGPRHAEAFALDAAAADADAQSPRSIST